MVSPLIRKILLRLNFLLNFYIAEANDGTGSERENASTESQEAKREREDWSFINSLRSKLTP